MSSSVALVLHHERQEARTLARAVAGWVADQGGEAWTSPSDAEATGLHDLAAERPLSAAGLVVSLGGDGTVLRTVDLLAGAPVPVLGVNVGQLGYLNEVEPAELLPGLERWRAGQFQIEERMLLSVETDEGPPLRALNEAVVERAEPSHSVRLEVGIGGTAFTTYVADGLIVATATGSTAYSLSVRGPIVSPRHRALLVTPIAAHMLFDRSLVLDPDEAVTVRVAGHRSAFLNVDGLHARLLPPGTTVRCVAAPDSARFVRFGERSFHQILKAKFGLADR